MSYIGGEGYDNEASCFDGRFSACCRGAGVRAPLVCGGVRRQETGDPEGYGHKTRVVESAHLDLPRRQGSDGRRDEMAVRGWAPELADQAGLEQEFPEDR